MCSNEQQALLPRDSRVQRKTAQLREKCVTVFNPQRPLNGPAVIFDCDRFRHRRIEKRGDLKSPRLFFGFEDFLNAVHQVLRAEGFGDVIIHLCDM